MKVWDIVKVLDEFYRDPTFFDFKRRFDKLKERIELKLILHKLNEIMVDHLNKEKVDPIIIKVDCDKNDHPEIVDTMQDPRNQMANPKELLLIRDKVYFTPNFLETFDIHGIKDAGLLKLRAKFFGTTIGIRLHEHY